MKQNRLFNAFAGSFIGMAALSLSFFVGADDLNHFDNNCAPLCTQDCGISNCCGTPCLPAPECAWAYNPPAYTRCGCDTACQNSFFDSFALRADFLWWRACEGGTQLGSEDRVRTFDTTISPPRSVVFDETRLKKPDFKYDPGFRLGIFNNCACDCWDFAVNWTHFHTKAKVNAASDLILVPPALTNNARFLTDWERIAGVNPLASHARYSLDLDTVDLEFGRKFYTSTCFVLRPQFGLRFARINQNYRVESELNFNSESILLTTASDVKSRSNFLAIGPRVGLDLELDIGCGLALVGQAAGSIVFGKFDNHSKERLQNFTLFGDAVGSLDYDTKNSAHRSSRAITDLAFGLKWDRCFEWCNRTHPVSVAFVWEHHAFHDMNNFDFAANGLVLTDVATVTPVSTGKRKYGNLYTQGLTFSATFGF